jgi:hypothetical protein
VGKGRALTGRAARRQLDREYGGFKGHLQRLDDDIVALEQRFLKTTAELTPAQEQRYSNIRSQHLAIQSGMAELPRLRAEGKFDPGHMRAVAGLAEQLRRDYRELVGELELQGMANYMKGVS